jgi:hypothetical protein
MVMDLHADQIQGFFNIPVDNIYATPILLGDLWKQNYDDLLVVSPGRRRRRARARDRQAARLRSCDHRQAAPKANVAEVMNIIGDVEGPQLRHHGRHRRHREHAVQGAHGSQGHGAKKVVAYCTHPVLSGGAVARIAESDMDEIVVTDTIRFPRCARLPSHPSTFVRATVGRNDDAHLERRIRQLTIHRLEHFHEFGSQRQVSPDHRRIDRHRAAAARAFAKAGCRVAIHYNASVNRAEEVAADVRFAGGEAFLVGGDFTSSAKAREVVKATADHFGGVDILINNAGGLVKRVQIAEVDDSFYDSVMDLNVRSLVAASSAAIPFMRRAGTATSST